MYLFLLSRVAVACEGGEDIALLSVVLDDAERALSVLDVPTFERAVERALSMMTCLDEPVSAQLAGSIHRMVGLRAFGRRERAASAYFAAARRADPSLLSPGSLFPKQSAVGDEWVALSLTDVPLATLPEPAEGWLTIDGTRGNQRAVGLPAVLQWQRGDGQIGATAYLGPDEPPDIYPIAVAAQSLPVRRNTAAIALASTTIGSGLAAAAMWGLSLHGQSRYLDLDDPVADARLDALRARTNALAVGSAGSAGVCALSGLLLAVRW